MYKNRDKFEAFCDYAGKDSLDFWQAWSKMHKYLSEMEVEEAMLFLNDDSRVTMYTDVDPKTIRHAMNKRVEDEKQRLEARVYRNIKSCGDKICGKDS